MDPVYTFFFVDETTGYAGGKNGALFKTVDGGDSWEGVSFQDDSYDYSSVYGLYFFDKNTGFSVGNRGRITRTIDGAESWSEYSPTYNSVEQIDFPANTVGYAKMIYDIFKTTDAGMSWESLGRPLPGKKTENFHFVDENVGYVIVGGEVLSDPSEFVYKTTDGGLTWTATNNGNPLEEEIDITSIDFLDEQNGYASGKRFAGNKRIFRTTDGGDSWQIVGGEQFSKMQFVSEVTGYGIGFSDETLFRTTDGGLSWEAFFVADEEIFDFDFVDPDNGYIGTSGAFMYKTENAGIDWQVLASVPSSFIEDVDFVTKEFGFVSTGDKIYRTEDGGESWAYEVQLVYIHDIGISNEKVYIGGVYGRILSSDYEVVSSHELIAAPENGVNLRLSPNPAEEFVYLNTSEQQNITAVAVFDLSGREIQSEQWIEGSRARLRLPNEESGLFIVSVTLDDRHVVSEKIVIQK
jgi:photosystem II stability/assembly factor-like uncharacterized protein